MNPHLYVPVVPAIVAVTAKRGIPLIVDPTIADLEQAFKAL